MFWPTTVHVRRCWRPPRSRSRRVIARRAAALGSAAFSWMMMAVALWSLTSATRWSATVRRESSSLIPASRRRADRRVMAAVYRRLQSSPPLFADRLLRVAVWIVPVLTFARILTNEQHHLHWAAIEEVRTAFGQPAGLYGRPLVLCTAIYSLALSSAPCCWRAACGVFRRRIGVRPRSSLPAPSCRGSATSLPDARHVGDRR